MGVRGSGGSNITAVQAGEGPKPSPAGAKAYSGCARPPTAGDRKGSSNASLPLEARYNDTLLIVQLHAKIKLSEQQLLEAAAWIALLSTKKSGLVSRITLALEYNMAKFVCAKDNVLDVAQSTIAALKASIGGFDVSPLSAVASGLAAGNSALKVSLDGVGDPQVSATTRGEKRVLSLITNGNRTNDVPMFSCWQELNNICPKSAMIRGSSKRVPAICFFSGGNPFL